MPNEKGSRALAFSLRRQRRQWRSKLFEELRPDGNSLPGSGQNVVRRVCGEGVAIGMFKHLLIAAHQLAAGEFSPASKFGFSRSGRWHGAGRLVSLRHGVIVPRTGLKQKGPGKTGALDISELKTDQRE